MKKIAVVTTFHANGLTQYAQRMIDSFSANWPSNITLYVYPENCQPVKPNNRIVETDLNTVAPLTAFKEKWKNVPKANGDISKESVLKQRKDAKKQFKWDAVRFAHKVYAIFDCASKTDADILIWMDADTICHSPISEQAINMLIPDNVDLCFLGRKGKFSECGLYAMNLKSEKTQQFLKKFQEMYDNAETGIFTLIEWHDSFVFDIVRKSMSLKELDWSSHLITGEGHPLINSEWGAYLDHLKGDRKSLGRSKLSDLKIKRTEAYWK